MLDTSVGGVVAEGVLGDSAPVPGEPGPIPGVAHGILLVLPSDEPKSLAGCGM